MNLFKVLTASAIFWPIALYAGPREQKVLNSCHYTSHAQQLTEHKNLVNDPNFESLCTTLATEGRSCSPQEIGQEAELLFDAAKSDPRLHDICCGNNETCRMSFLNLKMVFRDGAMFVAKAGPEGFVTFNRKAKFSKVSREHLRATIYHELGHKCFHHAMAEVDGNRDYKNKIKIAAEKLMGPDLYQCITITTLKQAPQEPANDHPLWPLEISLNENFATTIPMRILQANPALEIRTVLYTAISNCFFELPNLREKWCGSSPSPEME